MAMNYEAAKQFYEREGYPRVPRRHVERIVGEDQEEREIRLDREPAQPGLDAVAGAGGAAVHDRDAVGVAVPTGSGPDRVFLSGPTPVVTT